MSTGAPSFMRSADKEKRSPCAGGVRFAQEDATWVSSRDFSPNQGGASAQNQNQSGVKPNLTVDFPDANVVVVLPPLEFGGNLMEFSLQLLSGKVNKSDLSCLTYFQALDFAQTKSDEKEVSGLQGKAVVINERLSLLQGELLDLGLIILPQSQAEPTKEWFEKYASLYTSADIIVAPGEFGDAMSEAGKSSSASKKVTALSSQLWEAQAFPIDTPEGVTVTMHRLDDYRCILYIFQIPLTVNPKYLERPLNLQITSRLPFDTTTATDPNLPRQSSLYSSKSIVPAPRKGSSIGDVNARQLEKGKLVSVDSTDFSSATDPTAPLQQTWGADINAILYADIIRETETLQETLSAPTPYLSSIAYSSALTGGLCGRKTFLDYKQQNLDVAEVCDSSGDTTAANILFGFLEESNVSRNIDILDLAISKPADMIFNKSKKESTADSIASSYKQQEVENVVHFPVEIQKPFDLLTTLIESLMYMQIENITQDIPITIENIHIRSVSSHIQGEIPFELYPGEQYSVLLCLNEPPAHELGSQASWDSMRSKPAASGGSWVTGSLGMKKVLPVCLKWRISGSSSPSVWSQFGADCQLPVRTPIEVSLTCHCVSHPGGILTALLTVTNREAQDIDVSIFLPKDLHYHRSLQPSNPMSPQDQNTGILGDVLCDNQFDPPALIPLMTRSVLGRIPKNTSQSVHLQFLATRLGIHSFPPVMILDTPRGRRFIARGGEVVVVV